MVDQLLNSELNASRINTVEKCFGSSGVPLKIAGRVLVGEGLLVKMCRKKPKPRQFFLFNDILVYGTVTTAKKKYKKQRIIPLEGLELEDLKDSDEFTNGFQIRTPSKSFNVHALNEKDKRDWMLYLRRCLDDLPVKSNEGLQYINNVLPCNFIEFSNSEDKTHSSKEKAAVWVPDPDAAVCMRCNKTKFTYIQRRHHCRKCGSVVCNACSSKKFLLTHISQEPQRVCDRCFNSLMNSQQNLKDEFEQPVAEASSGLNDGELNKSVESISESQEDEEPTKFYECSDTTNAT